jgi:phosphoglycolate phosphatase
MKFTGVVFDLDGTLVDSIEDLGDSMNHVLRSHDLPVHDYESYKYFVGKGVRNLVISSLPEERRKDNFVDLCLDQMVDHYEGNCLNKTKLYDGIEELLSVLKKDGFRMAVFSNKREALTTKVVDALFASEFFDLVVGARPELPKKPDPAGALLISNHLNLSPEKMVYLGDTNIDMKTANNAGMYAVGVSWGFRTREELEEAGAQVVIDHPDELTGILGL